MIKGYIALTLKVDLDKKLREHAKKNSRTPQGQIAYWLQSDKKKS
jgi:hypothetical protein